MSETVDKMYDTQKILRRVGLSVYLLRCSKDMSAAALGKLLNKAECTVTSWERGEKTPSLKTILNICNIFNCSIENFIDIEKYIEEQHNNKGEVIFYGKRTHSNNG